MQRESPGSHGFSGKFYQAFKELATFCYVFQNKGGGDMFQLTLCAEEDPVT